jgi:hypothetical protein
MGKAFQNVKPKKQGAVFCVRKGRGKIAYMSIFAQRLGW